jgi:glucose/arabinose dehydrogenase
VVEASIATILSSTFIQLEALPSINNRSLKVEVVAQGLAFPSSMAFLGPDDILVLEKNTGMVKRIVNGTMLPEPLLDVNVAHQAERGMLGIAVSPKHQNDGNNNTRRYVFLYYTEASTKDGDDITEGRIPLGNRIYRYELADNNTKLINPTLLLDLPAIPSAAHNGGAITIGPDDNIYLPIGNVNDQEIHSFQTRAQNIENASDPNGTAGILRITQNGKPVNNDGNNSILGNQFPINLYYAYGIRNSFGIDFDPVTKKLWDTENGPNFGDEINLVEPGFNSGWISVQGIWNPAGGNAGNITLDPDNLVDFNGTGKYSSPEFTWKKTVGVTAIKFLNSDKLGKQYQNDMFVGDFHNGYLYHFDLNKNRTGLVLNGSLADRIADSPEEFVNSSIIFGKGFGGITDIEEGPYDGYLYILTLYRGGNDCTPENSNIDCLAYSSSAPPGTIFKIKEVQNIH